MIDPSGYIDKELWEHYRHRSASQNPKLKLEVASMASTCFPAAAGIAALLSWLNSNKGTKTLTGLSPKAFEQAFGSLSRGGTAVRRAPAACSWFFESFIFVPL
jgi:hypothetical protein